jgi:hypothetical protein
VRAQFRDNAGNSSATAQDTIVLDTMPPTGSITIDGGAATTGSASVTLTLAASDAGGSGLKEMSFSNDGTVWSSWEPYATTKAWVLAGGAGSKTVRVRFRDNAGNSSATAQDTIAFEPAQLQHDVFIPLIAR